MTGIVGKTNLKRYLDKDRPWAFSSLLYDRLPVLSLRSYQHDDKKNYWPLCWEDRRVLRMALSLTVDLLKPWQAFRGNRRVSAETIRKKLLKRGPRIILQLQADLIRAKVYCARDLARKDRLTRVRIVRKMSRAVSDISSLKGSSTPMLGSKIFSFLLPEFFPVWDIAWIKKQFARLGAVGTTVPEFQKQLKNDPAARYYSHYTWRMLEELRRGRFSRKKHDLLKAMCIMQIQKKWPHPLLEHIVDDNLWDLSPILFEVCVIAARSTSK